MVIDCLLGLQHPLDRLYKNLSNFTLWVRSGEWSKKLSLILCFERKTENNLELFKRITKNLKKGMRKLLKD